MLELQPGPPVGQGLLQARVFARQLLRALRVVVEVGAGKLLFEFREAPLKPLEMGRQIHDR
jgi:hypothetical protein